MGRVFIVDQPLPLNKASAEAAAPCIPLSGLMMRKNSSKVIGDAFRSLIEDISEAGVSTTASLSSRVNMTERSEGLGAHYAAAETDSVPPKISVEREDSLQSSLGLSRSEPHFLNLLPDFHIGQTVGDETIKKMSHQLPTIGSASNSNNDLTQDTSKPTARSYESNFLDTFVSENGGLHKSTSAIDTGLLKKPTFSVGSEQVAINKKKQSSNTLETPRFVFGGITPVNSPALNAKNQLDTAAGGSLLKQAAELVQHGEQQQQQKKALGGIFGRGFFAKPVLANPQETYRYIMALER